MQLCFDKTLDTTYLNLVKSRLSLRLLLERVLYNERVIKILKVYFIVQCACMSAEYCIHCCSSLSVFCVCLLKLKEYEKRVERLLKWGQPGGRAGGRCEWTLYAAQT